MLSAALVCLCAILIYELDYSSGDEMAVAFVVCFQDVLEAEAGTDVLIAEGIYEMIDAESPDAEYSDCQICLPDLDLSVSSFAWPYRMDFLIVYSHNRLFGADYSHQYLPAYANYL